MFRLVGITILALCGVQFATPAQAGEYDGAWVGNVTCNGQYVEPQPWPLTVVVTGGVVAASTPNGSGTGVIAGSRVTFTLATIGNAAHFTGTVHGRRMSGSYVQMGSGPCTWFANRAGTDPAQHAAKEVLRAVKQPSPHNRRRQNTCNSELVKRYLDEKQQCDNRRDIYSCEESPPDQRPGCRTLKQSVYVACLDRLNKQYSPETRRCASP